MAGKRRWPRIGLGKRCWGPVLAGGWPDLAGWGCYPHQAKKKSVFWCMGVSWHHVRGRPTVGARVLEPAGNTSVHIPIDSSVLNSVTQRVDEIFISKRISNGGLVNGLIE